MGSYEFCLPSDSVMERVDFGVFEVLLCDNGAMFRDRNGYHVFVSPYSAGIGGDAHEKSLYSWLKSLCEMKKSTEGHEAEEYAKDAGITNADMLETLKIVTMSTLLRPLTEFIDVDRAVKNAEDYMRWLADKERSLMAAMDGVKVSEGDAVKVDEMERVRVDTDNELSEMSDEAEKVLDKAAGNAKPRKRSKPKRKD